MDVSTRYAEDQKLLDQKYLKEAKAIPAQTQIDVTFPSYESEFDLLFETSKRNTPWAEFYAPSKYSEQKKRLFTFQTIPALGSEDKKESQAQKILSKIQASAAQRQVREKGEEKDQKQKKKQWEESREAEQEEKEKKILIKLLDCIIKLDKYIMDVNARRTQYQKG